MWGDGGRFNLVQRLNQISASRIQINTKIDDRHNKRILIPMQSDRPCPAPCAALPTRRRLLAAGAAVALLPQAVGSFADPLPTLRLLLGAPAGGPGDLMARRLAERLRGDHARAVVVDNRSGAGGQLAVVALKEAPTDGSVLLLVPSSIVSIYPHTYKRLPYRVDVDLAPVALVAHAPLAFGVGPAVPASVQTFRDFGAWTQANPQQASYGSPASGSIAHLMAAAVAQASGSPMSHVPYRGGALAISDLRGGTLPALSATLGVFLPHLASGTIRLLAVSGDTRTPLAPNVPTWREQGLPFTAREWYGFFAPGRAPREVVERSAAAIVASMNTPDVAAVLAGFGLEAGVAGPERLASLIKADSEEWRGLIRRIGFTAES
jgi:tripartite-type tricarboxylate transporter receptor subunit TctC